MLVETWQVVVDGQQHAKASISPHRQACKRNDDYLMAGEDDYDKQGASRRGKRDRNKAITAANQRHQQQLKLLAEAEDQHHTSVEREKVIWGTHNPECCSQNRPRPAVLLLLLCC